VHHEPPDETTGALELDVGADDGDLSFAIRRLELGEDDGVAVCPLGEEDEEGTAAGALDRLAAAVVEFEEELAWVDVIPGRLEAIPAAAMMLAVVAEIATALTRARPRFLAATSPWGS